MTQSDVIIPPGIFWNVLLHLLEHSAPVFEIFFSDSDVIALPFYLHNIPTQNVYKESPFSPKNKNLPLEPIELSPKKLQTEQIAA